MDFLFDIGRVLLDFDFNKTIQRLTSDETKESNERFMFSIEDKTPLESGLIETNEFIKQAIEASGHTFTHACFEAAWRSIFTPNPPMWRVARNLKAQEHHRLILFSNTNAIHCPWIFDEYPEFAIFDGAVLSYQVGSMKPHAPIYEHAIREFGLIPEQTRYIDDLPDNIATGRRFGFRCHQYDQQNHAAFETWLATELAAGGPART